MSEDWIKALTFAALPGAARVQFKARKLVEDGTPTLNYHLHLKQMLATSSAMIVIMIC
ncbi:MAG: hypothetical protein AAGK66_07530 [Pseudomonadota bacterium]